MNRRSILALSLILSQLSFVLAQQPAATQKPAEQDNDNVVKITTNLVQVDAIVTDKKGRVITDLAAEDFQIFEDGRPQQITNFSFVPTGSPSSAEQNVAAAPAASRDKSGATVSVPVPPVRLRPEQVRRTIALVVDDLGLSFESTHFVRQALKKFVDQQMQEGDLVAITRTGAGVGALQQFTADKRLLYAAIERVRYNAYGRAGVAAFGAIDGDAQYSEDQRGGRAGRYTSTQATGQITPDEFARNARNQVNDYKEEIFSVGTLGAVNYIIRGLKDLPGRKSVVLMSDSLALFNSEGKGNYRTLEALRRLTDVANRASVVVYTLDPRGLQVLLDTAANGMTGATKGQNGEVGAACAVAVVLTAIIFAVTALITRLQPERER